jgi:hypothetical protein
MEATTTQVPATEFVIPAAHREAAERYIAAIVKRDPVNLVGGEFVAARTKELQDRFDADYANLGRGAYARHGADALRIALGKL